MAFENVAATTELLEALKERNRVAASVETSSSVCGIPETPTVLTMGLSHLRDALSAMPEDLKKDYLTATEVVPNLVQSESDPVWFLRRESFNPWAAARRLARHWDCRNYLYGPKWLHAGDGKLDAEETEILQSGWFVVIPRPPQTTLIYLDTTKLEQDCIDEKLRVAFHICAMLGKHSSAQREGVVLIHNNIQPKWLSLESLGVMIEMIHRATPMKISKCLILCSTTDEKGSTADIVNTKLHQTHVNLFGSDASYFINIDDAAACASELEEVFEICGGHVPVDLGGQWGYERLMEWQDTIASPDSDPPASMSFLASSRASSSGDDRDRAEDLSKARNALYARRAYQKRKAKEAEIQQEVEAQQRMQAVLRRENERLEHIMRQALSVLALYKSSEEDRKKARI